MGLGSPLGDINTAPMLGPKEEQLPTSSNVHIGEDSSSST